MAMAQLTQSLASSLGTEPATQTEHAADAVRLAILPAVQGEHTLEGSCAHARNVPLLQASHATEPVAASVA